MTPNETPKENSKPIFTTEENKVLDTQNLNPVRFSHSNYIGKFDFNTNSFARKEKFLSNTYIGKSNLSGYGVFASKDIDVGEIIEECPAVLLDTTFQKNQDWVLQRYGMTWDCNCEVCRVNGKTIAIFGGNGLFYNHSEKPNAYIVQDYHLKLYRFYALSPIKKDDEITWYYGMGYAERLRNEKNNPNANVVPEGMQDAINSIKLGHQVYSQPNAGVSPDCPCKNKKKAVQTSSTGCSRNKTSDTVEAVEVVATKDNVSFWEAAEASTKRYEERIKNGEIVPVVKLTDIQSSVVTINDDDDAVTSDVIDINNLQQSFNQTDSSENTTPVFRSMVVPEKILND